MKKVIHASAIPLAIGPYSPAIAANGFVFVSGQIGVDPHTGLLHEGIEEQTCRAMASVKALLESAGSGLDRIVRATVYLISMDDFAAMNHAYGSFFESAPPARVCVEVRRLPKDARVEIDAIAVVGP